MPHAVLHDGLLRDLQDLQLLLPAHQQLAVDQRQRRPVVARLEDHRAGDRLEAGRMGSTRYSFVLPSVVSSRPSARIDPPGQTPAAGRSST